MNRSILIIGGTGCISSAVVAECLKQGIDTTILNRGRRISNISKEVHLIKADKSDEAAIKSALENKHYDAIVDFLCYTPEELENSVKLYSSHTNQYFFISSCAVYDFRKTQLGKETSPKVDDRWTYSINKWDAENRLRELSRKIGFNYTIIRPSITYGDTRIPYGITPPYGQHGTFIQRILHEKPIITWNKGENFCNMMRVEDFARAFVFLIGHPSAMNEEFNICSERAYSFNEVLSIVSEYLGKPICKVDMDSVTYGNLLKSRKGEIVAGRGTNCISSLSKLKKIYPEFKEEYSLKEGIQKTIDSYYRENWQNGMDYGFDGETDYIITKYLGNNPEIKDKYNLKFIDYLKENKTSNLKEYQIGRKRNRWPRQTLNKIRRVLSKIYHFIKI